MKYLPTLLELRKYRVQDGWAELLMRYPWQWFGTLTFTDAIHPEAALKAFAVWRNKLNCSLFGRKWRDKPPFGIYYVLAIEYQKRQVIHFHFLIAGVGDARRLTWMDEWEAMKHKCGFPRIYAVETQQGACRYVSKYVTKDGEIFLSDNLPDVTAGFGKMWLEPTPDGLRLREADAAELSPGNG